MATWLALISAVCLGLVRGTGQLATDDHRENGNTTWLEPRSLNRPALPLPGTPTLLKKLKLFL
ncbi:unnamed protein product, partial [Rangifer tarandus platyrhynchus]